MLKSWRRGSSWGAPLLRVAPSATAVRGHRQRPNGPEFGVAGIDKEHLTSGRRMAALATVWAFGVPVKAGFTSVGH